MYLVLIIFILVIVGIFNYNNLYGQEFNPSDFDNIVDNNLTVDTNDTFEFSTSDFDNIVDNNLTVDTNDTFEFSTSDFDNPDTNFLSNAEIIAQEISLYTDTEIRDYPLADLSAEEIKAVFMILDLGNITKILLNIPVNVIQEIQNKLSEEEFNSILNRVSIENQTQIKERIDNN